MPIIWSGVEILRNEILLRNTLSFNKIISRIVTFKGYLRYKTLTSQNLSSEAQIKIFFIS